MPVKQKPQPVEVSQPESRDGIIISHTFMGAVVVLEIHLGPTTNTVARLTPNEFATLFQESLWDEDEQRLRLEEIDHHWVRFDFQDGVLSLKEVYKKPRGARFALETARRVEND